MHDFLTLRLIDSSVCRTMVTQLIQFERIETTHPRAKELSRMADACITLAKKVRFVLLICSFECAPLAVHELRLCAAVVRAQCIVLAGDASGSKGGCKDRQDRKGPAQVVHPACATVPRSRGWLHPGRAVAHAPGGCSSHGVHRIYRSPRRTSAAAAAAATGGINTQRAVIAHRSPASP
jgi:hypothetical protein